jgi:outer membrane protein assembly factor BamB
MSMFFFVALFLSAAHLCESTSVAYANGSWPGARRDASASASAALAGGPGCRHASSGPWTIAAPGITALLADPVVLADGSLAAASRANRTHVARVAAALGDGCLGPGASTCPTWSCPGGGAPAVGDPLRAAPGEAAWWCPRSPGEGVDADAAQTSANLTCAAAGGTSAALRVVWEVDPAPAAGLPAGAARVGDGALSVFAQSQGMLVAFGSPSGAACLAALDAPTGASLWGSCLPGATGPPAGAAVLGDRDAAAFLATRDGAVARFDVVDGSVVWAVTLWDGGPAVAVGAPVGGAPAVAADGALFVATGGADPRVHRVTAADGVVEVSAALVPAGSPPLTPLAVASSPMLLPLPSPEDYTIVIAVTGNATGWLLALAACPLVRRRPAVAFQGWSAAGPGMPPSVVTASPPLYDPVRALVLAVDPVGAAVRVHAANFTRAAEPPAALARCPPAARPSTGAVLASPWGTGPTAAPPGLWVGCDDGSVFDTLAAPSAAPAVSVSAAMGHPAAHPDGALVFALGSGALRRVVPGAVVALESATMTVRDDAARVVVCVARDGDGAAALSAPPFEVVLVPEPTLGGGGSGPATATPVQDFATAHRGLTFAPGAPRACAELPIVPCFDAGYGEVNETFVVRLDVRAAGIGRVDVAHSRARVVVVSACPQASRGNSSWAMAHRDPQHTSSLWNVVRPFPPWVAAHPGSYSYGSQSAPIIGPDGSVTWGTDTHVVSHAADGTAKFTTSATYPGGVTGCMHADGRTMYISLLMDRNLYIVDAQGGILFNRQLAWPYLVGPVIDNAGNWVGCGDRGACYSFEEVGTERFYVNVDGLEDTVDSFRSTPAVLAGGDVLVCNRRGFMWRRRAVDFSVVWTWAGSPGSEARRLTLAPSGDVVYITMTGTGGELVSVDVATGATSAGGWPFGGLGSPTTAPAVTRDGRKILLGTGDGNLFAVNAADASQAWVTQIPGGIVRGDPAITHDGAIAYTTMESGRVVGVRIADGAVVLSEALLGSISRSPPSLYMDGSLVVTSSGGAEHVVPHFVVTLDPAVGDRVTVNELDGQILLFVHRTGLDQATAFSVDLSLDPGNATGLFAPEDGFTLKFAPGEVVQGVEVLIRDGGLTAAGTFTARLENLVIADANVTGYITAGTGRAVDVTILDEVAPPLLVRDCTALPVVTAYADEVIAVRIDARQGHFNANATQACRPANEGGLPTVPAAAPLSAALDVIHCTFPASNPPHARHTAPIDVEVLEGANAVPNESVGTCAARIRLLQRWRGSLPREAVAGEAFALQIEGAGFAVNSSEYRCELTLLNVTDETLRVMPSSGPATVESSTSLACPFDPTSTADISSPTVAFISISEAGAEVAKTGPAATLLLVSKLVVSPVSPDPALLYLGGGSFPTPVVSFAAVHGSFAANADVYRCVTVPPGTGVAPAAAVILSPYQVSCTFVTTGAPLTRTPVGTPHNVLLIFAVSGTPVQTNLTITGGHHARLAVIQTTGAASPGALTFGAGDIVTLTGSGFDPAAGDYSCSFRGPGPTYTDIATVSATTVTATSIVCPLPVLAASAYVVFGVEGALEIMRTGNDTSHRVQVVARPPAAPAPPVVSVVDFAQTGTVAVRWTPATLPESGGLAVLSYAVYWRIGTVGPLTLAFNASAAQGEVSFSGVPVQTSVSAALALRTDLGLGPASSPLSTAVTLCRAPSIAALAPSAITASTAEPSAPVYVTLTGSAFGAGAGDILAVSFGAVNATQVVWESATRLVVTRPPVTPPPGINGSAVEQTAVVVSTACRVGGGGGSSSGGGVTVLASAPRTFAINFVSPPVVTAFSPVIARSRSATVVEIFGFGFGAGAAAPLEVRVAGVVCANPTRALPSGEIRCTVGGDDMAVPRGHPDGPVIVVADAVSSAPSEESFRFSPQIDSIEPSVVPVDGGVTLTLRGPFVGVPGELPPTGAILADGTLCAPLQAIDDETVTCSIPTGPPPPTRVVGVPTPFVATADPGAAPLQGASAAVTFSADAGAARPEPLRASPARGVLAGGVDVVVTGAHLGASAADLSQVTLAGVPCAQVTWLSAEAVSCLAGHADAARTGPIRTATFSGGGSVPSNETATFTYYVVHDELDVAPSSGPVDGAIQVAVTVPHPDWLPGGSLSAEPSVTFGTTAATEAAYITRSRILCVAPPHAPGEVPVTVGSGVLAVGRFTFVQPTPVILNARPRLVRSAGGTLVTLRGANFGRAAPTSGLQVWVDTQVCADATWVSPEEVTCVTPPIAAGASARDLPLTVVVNGKSSGPTPIGVITSTAGFRYGGEVQCSEDCGFQDVCDDVTGLCTACIPGFTGDGCTTHVVQMHPLNEPMVAYESDGVRASPRIVVSLAAAPGAPVTLRIVRASSGEDEVGFDPPELQFDDRTFADARTVTVTALDDGIRDGNRTIPVTCNLVNPGPSILAGVVLFPIVNVRTIDAFPTVVSFSPTVVPLVGGVIATLNGDHWDDRVEVWIGGVRAGEYDVVRSFAERDAARLEFAVASSHLPELAEGVSKGDNDGGDPTAGRYLRLSLVNVMSGTYGAADNLVYVTSDCPEEGQFGRGKDCRECPEGADCPGGYRLWPKPGYWNPGEGSGYVSRCSPPKSCLGTRSSLCAPGYEGFMCGKCSKDFYRGNGACQPCPVAELTLVFIVGDIVVWLIFAASAVAVRDRMTLSYIVMFVRSLSLLGAVGKTIEAENVPRWIITLYEVLYIFSGDYSFIKPDCVTPAPWSQIFGVSLAYNIAVFVPVWLALGVAYVVSGESRYDTWLADVNEVRGLANEAADGSDGDSSLPVVPPARPRTRDYWTDRAVRMLVIWCAVVYLAVTSFALETLSCTPVGNNGAYRMVTQPHTTCYKGDHIFVTAASCVLLVGFTIGFPLGMLRWVKRAENREKLHSDERFMERWNFLYEFYNIKNPTFWLVEFPITCIVAAGHSALRPHVNYQMSISVAVFAYKLVYICVRRPFIDWMTDLIQGVMALVSLVAINMTFFSRHRIFERVPALSVSLSVLVATLLAVAVVGIVAVIIVLIIRPAGVAEMMRRLKLGDADDAGVIVEIHGTAELLANADVAVDLAEFGAHPPLGRTKTNVAEDSREDASGTPGFITTTFDYLRDMLTPRHQVGNTLMARTPNDP